jgi:hypothetical protein
MKVFLITINIFLLLAFALAGYAVFSYSSPSKPKALLKTPEASDIKFPTAMDNDRSKKIPALAALWEHNLFDPKRGNEDAVVDAPIIKNSEMELIGICRYGETAGAIILISQKNVVAPQRNPRFRRGRRTPVPQPQVQKQQNQQKQAKRYYRIGQTMDNGYVLKEVNSDSVLVSRGSDELVLKMDYADKGSSNRISVATAKPPEKKAAPAFKPPGKNKSKEAPKNKSGKLPSPPPPPPLMKNVKSSSFSNELEKRIDEREITLMIESEIV